MVEKVFISPNRVRAYGNIVNMKTGDDFTLVNSELTVTTDTVDGAEMTVFQFGVEGGISIALVSSSSTCNVGDNVLLTATVLDDSAPVEAAEVTFKVGETVLGTDETDANGVATYTYAASTAGTFSFTASYQDSTSPVVSVSVNHSYSISFSQSSYVATGGSATLECTLLEDNVAKTGASVTVTGTDSSTYTATTNSNGVASVTVTGISASTVFTATYQGATATCTVTVQTYLFYDECTSADGLSNYGEIRPISSSTTTSYLEYNSSNNAYYVHANGDWGIIPITALNGLDNYKITAEFKTKASGNTYQGGIGFIAETGTSNVVFRKYGTACNSVVNDSSQKNIGTIRSANSYWHKFEITKQGKNFSVTVTDVDNDTIIGTLSRTISFDTYYVGFMTVAGTNYGSYVRNIVAESL